MKIHPGTLQPGALAHTKLAPQTCKKFKFLDVEKFIKHGKVSQSKKVSQPRKVFLTMEIFLGMEKFLNHTKFSQLQKCFLTVEYTRFFL